MALKKPIVINTDGTKSVIQAGDTIPIANLATGTPDGTKFIRDDGTLATAFGTILSGTTTFEFPPIHEDETVVNTITSGLITNANIKNITFIPLETNPSNNNLDDFVLNGLIFNIENIINNVSFDLRARAYNMTSGNYDVKYIIVY